MDNLRVTGGIAQLGERVLCKHEVVGSIPSASTKDIFELFPVLGSAKLHETRSRLYLNLRDKQFQGGQMPPTDLNFKGVIALK